MGNGRDPSREKGGRARRAKLPGVKADDRPARLRVLTMADSIGVYGGAEALARQVAAALDPERFESVFCVTRWNPDPRAEAMRAELEASGVGFIGLKRSGKLDIGAWRRLVAEMRGRRIHVLHTHKIGSNFWGALITPRVPVPVFVAHEHTWSWQGKPHRKLADRWLIARRAAAFVAVSEADRARMTEIEHIPPEKTRFIPNGIQAPVATRSGAEIREELGIPAAAPVVGMVAVLRPQKAYDVLVRAAAILKQRVPGVRVLIVGGEENPRAELRAGLESMAAELGLTETLIFTGGRKDAFDVIGAFDVAALSSDFEGSPISILEYMEAGKPIVATRVGGVPDQVVDGQTGLLVDPQDPEALAQALASLLTDRPRAEAMGRAGQERRRTVFSIEATTRRVEELYDELYLAAARS